MCDSVVSCISCVVCIGILLAAGLALGLYFGYFDEQDIEDATGLDVPSLPPFFFNDPYEGVPQEETAKWSQPTSGEDGLALTIVNHCQSQWESEFTAAIADWDNGTPDALTLSTSTGTYDDVCEFQDGIMKVCNLNYGETGWKGLNEYMVDTNNIIVNSRAKMNEYYLENVEGPERRYVMCHEIGHGFGLAHTDESFINANLGNCLDYTNVFTDEQIRPGTINYERLQDKYGIVNRRQRERQLDDNNNKNATTTNATSLEWMNQNQNERVVVPDWLHQRYAEQSDVLLAGNRDDLIANGWVMIDQSSWAAQYALALGEGYYVKVAMLLAN